MIKCFLANRMRELRKAAGIGDRSSAVRLLSCQR